MISGQNHLVLARGDQEGIGHGEFGLFERNTFGLLQKLPRDGVDRLGDTQA